ncbi:hypothetical protein ANO11243_080050 [Dothideomycetidae sp. 11243]|nr:hypothetical protein ANO11243_080050 [fungal sp. No.11243]
MDGVSAEMPPASGLEFEDFADFSKLLPTFVKPDQPCEYCRARKLDCHMYFGKVTCTSCDALFRTCSFAKIDGHDSQYVNSDNTNGVVDTLHIVQEDVCTSWGALTGTKQLRSKSTKPSTAAHRVNAEKKPAPRFSKPAIRVLRAWYEAHLDYPYPSEDDKIELEQSTGLKPAQIATWLANTRRRSRKPGPKTEASALASGSSGPIDMPGGGAATKEWRDLNPFERWQHSPPENEPAPFDAIADAVASSVLLQEGKSSPESVYQRASTSGTSFSVKRATSITSQETSLDDSASKSMKSSAAWSHGSQSSFGSFGSFGSGLHGKRDRQRKRTARAVALRRSNSDDDKRIYQCTFCCDRFKTKYDWTRHEKTLHLSLEKWVCTPCGAIESHPTTGAPVCAYCRAENPDHAHIENHGHTECVSKGVEAKTFFRKDHLRQHLRLVHHCELTPAMESWKAVVDAINSRCGFCAVRFNSWAERNDHLATHFRQGAQMKDWKRCRGLDPQVAANVLNAMPPYLIGIESRSQIPFSAANNRFVCSHSAFPREAYGEQEGHTALDTNKAAAAFDPSKPTCWEILTVLLAKFVNEQIALGNIITDEALQSEARRLLYGDDDPWNQTPVDDSVWLDLFKKAYCHKMLPTVVGGVGENIPEDIEIYTDLGMRIPFSVQQQRLDGSNLASPVPQFGMRTPSSSCRSSETPGNVPPLIIQKPTDFNASSYEDLPLYASRVACFAAPPLRNPLIYDGHNNSPVTAPLSSNQGSTPLDEPRSDSLAGMDFSMDVEKMLAELSDLGPEIQDPQDDHVFTSQPPHIEPSTAQTSHQKNSEPNYDPLEFINVDMLDVSAAPTDFSISALHDANDGQSSMLLEEDFMIGELQF